MLPIPLQARTAHWSLEPANRHVTAITRIPNFAWYPQDPLLDPMAERPLSAFLVGRGTVADAFRYTEILRNVMAITDALGRF
jgi:hypothetical protein